MRLHRFIGDFDLNKSPLKIKDSELVNQIRNVLRLEKGAEFILSDGDLNEARVIILEMTKDTVEVDISEKLKNENEPEQNVALYCSILKKENFELVVQKATEIGVREIIPVISSRTIKLDVRLDRLKKIINEAGEQSGRGILPNLREPIKFEDAIKEAYSSDKLNILFDKSGESLTTLNRQNNKGRIGIWIGPEGGWTDQEIESAKSAGFKILNLGKLTLRAETAAITSSFIIVNKFSCS